MGDKALRWTVLGYSSESTITFLLLNAANAARDQACPECMVTVLYVHQAGEGYVENSCPGSPQQLKILTHAWPLSPTAPEYEDPGVEVLVVGSRRSRPETKHSNWLRDREHLDKLKVKVRCFASKLAYNSL